MNVPKDRPLNAAELKRLGDELSKMEPQAIRDLAKNYPSQPADSKSTVVETLKDIEGGKVQNVPTTPADGEKQVDKKEQSADGDSDEGEGDEGGGPKSVDASTRPTNVKRPAILPVPRSAS